MIGVFDLQLQTFLLNKLFTLLTLSLISKYMCLGLSQCIPQLVIKMMIINQYLYNNIL